MYFVPFSYWDLPDVFLKIRLGFFFSFGKDDRRDKLSLSSHNIKGA